MRFFVCYNKTIMKTTEQIMVLLVLVLSLSNLFFVYMYKLNDRAADSVISETIIIYQSPVNAIEG